MKIFKTIAYSIFLLGIMLKFAHVLGASALMLLAILVMCVYLLITVIRKQKDTGKRMPDIIGFVLLMLYIYLDARINFYPLHWMFYVAVVAVVAVTIFQARNKDKVKFPFLLMWIVFLFSIVLHVIPSSKVHYAFYLLNNSNRSESSRDWYYYSWYLYHEGKFNESLQANDSALVAIVNSQMKAKNDRNEMDELKKDSIILTNKRKELITHTWNVLYPE